MWSASRERFAELFLAIYFNYFPTIMIVLPGRAVRRGNNVVGCLDEEAVQGHQHVSYSYVVSIFEEH